MEPLKAKPIDDRGLEQLNAASNDDAHAALLRCCGSDKWALRMIEARPFRNMEEVRSMADRIWSTLEADDWLEAFAAHPKIGEKKTSRSTSVANGWAEQEQSGASRASQLAQAALKKANHEYEEKFGFIYIVCATGKSADEMLALLNERLQNDSYSELRIAADEQRRITQIRLDKLIGEWV
jgi:OHCU decarboxylase